ncbi:MAG: ArsR/SmtB family transcription factor [Phycisphaerae bacterium]
MSKLGTQSKTPSLSHANARRAASCGCGCPTPTTTGTGSPNPAPKTKASFVDVSRMFRAFSDHTRLRILNLLSGGELCVCDIVRVLDMSQPKVSRHLAYLRRSGLVLARRQGLWMHYRLAAPLGTFHKTLLTCLAECFADVPQLALDRAKLDQIHSGTAGRGCSSPADDFGT